MSAQSCSPFLPTVPFLHLSAPRAGHSQQEAPCPGASFQNLLNSGLNATRKVTHLTGRTRRKHKTHTAHFGPNLQVSESFEKEEE